MSALAATDTLFFGQSDAKLDPDAARRVLRDALADLDDGELYLEYRENESISLDDGRIRSAGFDTARGFGLRAVSGERMGYAHAGALVNLEVGLASAGEMEVVPGAGWPGVLLHEAVGHGPEGDFNREETSAFAGPVGRRVAAPGVRVADDGGLPDRRGSLRIDGEGTPSGRTVMIEDGILRGFIQDRLNARLMGVALAGNGRRQSYAHAPMPRITSTMMLAGMQTAENLVRPVKPGLCAVDFGGGQVDITSGKFVFPASEASLIGNGPDILTRITGIGDVSLMDPGKGICGKDGQGVPVGVGRPMLKLAGLTVGGTA